MKTVFTASEALESWLKSVGFWEQFKKYREEEMLKEKVKKLFQGVNNVTE